MSVVSTLLIAAVVALLALTVGVTARGALAPRLRSAGSAGQPRRRASPSLRCLQHVVSQSPIGMVVVDVYRDVVFINDRARELGLVRDRQLDDRAWLAAERTLATGEDVEVDLSTASGPPPAARGCRCGVTFDC